MLNSKEHYELLAQFEKDCRGCGSMDKEPKADWARGIIYQDGHTNNFFKVYRQGYVLGKCVERQEA